MDVYHILLLIVTFAASSVAAYLKTKAKLNGEVMELIDSAESTFQGKPKAGADKYDWVVSQLYALVPLPLRIVFTRELLGSLVNSAFSAIEHYAGLQHPADN